MFLRYPMGWTNAFPTLCKPESFHESYSPGDLPDKISTLQLHRKWEVNDRLRIGEVGVDLELCVHAHGNDIELIMGASHNSNYPLVTNSSYIYGLMIYKCGPSHIVHLRSQFSDKLKGTCLPPINIPLQLLFWSAFEYYPMVSRDYHGTT